MQRRTSFSTPAALLLAALSALFTLPVGAGSLTGIVRNAATLDPVSGADVTVHVLIPDSLPLPTVTGPDGSYGITGIPPGNEIYVVIAWKYGFMQSYTRIADLGSQDLVFDIALQPDTAGVPPGGGGDSGSVAGTIYVPGIGGAIEGLPGATVTLNASGGGEVVTSSGADGSYSARIPSGAFAVSVTGTGFDNMTVTGLAVDSLGANVNVIVKKTVTDVDGDPPPVPVRHTLGQNYPNPFNPRTTIGYSLPEAEYVRLSVYSMLGEEVAVLVEGLQEPGEKRVSFDAAGLPSGVYTYRIIAGAFSTAKSMLLLK